TWYKDAIIYELHVRAFNDSNADGVGDFPGLIDKLDYLKDLGVTALWLLPFYPSPGRDDGYDIADYYAVNPSYGDLRDVRRFVREAHRRDMRVITELVCNHTSDTHPWFQRARRARPGSAARDFYVWSDTADKYREARIIFKDFETSNWTWDPVAAAYYWHRFYSHQPDLNYDNPQVLKALMRVLDFWMEMGVDGLRLDAVPYLVEREGTNCENLPETHDILKKIRRHVDERFTGRLLLAEANQWPEDAVHYFGTGDECHMSFHFPLMPRLFMSIQMEDRFPIIDILAQTPPIPETSQWALFLRNHDELTLEMVTDEERDYMYRVYTEDPSARINLGIRRRLAPLLSNNRRRIELMNGLLFSLPGTPVLYYGDEIGMGDNIYLGDRNGVRTPMQWSGDRNAGFSRANRQRLYLPVIVDPEYHYESVNVEAQQANAHSLLSWTRRLIELRKRHSAFGRGTLEFLHPENRKVLGFVRRNEQEQIMVIANLSRFVQYVELDLSRFAGSQPVEMFGGVEFPPVADRPYFLTLGPHAFYWFTMQPVPIQLGVEGGAAGDIPELIATNSWQDLVSSGGRARFEQILPSFLQVRRWYGGKARRLKSTRLSDAVPIPYGGSTAVVVTVRCEYAEGDPETYAIPLSYAAGAKAAEVLKNQPGSVLCRVGGLAEPGVLFDALTDPDFAEERLDGVARRRKYRGQGGSLSATPGSSFMRLRGADGARLDASLGTAEQSNNSVMFGERLIMKLYRRVEEGVNPDLEVSRFLSERVGFPSIPPVAGSLDYRFPNGRTGTLGLLQGYVPNQGDAWAYTLAQLDRYLDHPSALGQYLERAALLGRRTAELHLALASDPDDAAFAPAPSTMLDQRSVYQSVRAQANLALDMLRQPLPASVQDDARLLLELEGELMGRLRGLLQRPITASRIRTHGDYHLGQVLWTGGDFVIIDFEGEPARPLAERRLKRWPQRDVAGMLRSFDYASHTALRARPKVDPRLARDWSIAVRDAYLHSYYEVAGGAPFLPPDETGRTILLDTFLLEKALYEVRYELNNRPEWVGIPLRGVLQLMGVSE
ncbi:MAG: maltose alpha-D-glucosyltransferase, partial [Candidatus Dormibacteraeota bacterium]|nr:maltose alpha-D-glucosyltransferase [Candidatus Dormibacteraeota bacterium]